MNHDGNEFSTLFQIESRERRKLYAGCAQEISQHAQIKLCNNLLTLRRSCNHIQFTSIKKYKFA